MQKQLCDLLAKSENFADYLAEYEKNLKKVKNPTPEKLAFLSLFSIEKVVAAKSLCMHTHSRNMMKIIHDMAVELKLTTAQISKMVLVARFHDIGKFMIPSCILNQKNPLTDEQWVLIKKHPIYSSEIMKTTKVFEYLANGVLHHHEHFDGSGYPFGKKGKEIPLSARILAIIDAYEVLTSGRSYKPAVSPREAMAEIKRCSGSQFDPEIVFVFEGVMKTTHALDKKQPTLNRKHRLNPVKQDKEASK